MISVGQYKSPSSVEVFTCSKRHFKIFHLNDQLLSKNTIKHNRTSNYNLEIMKS